MHFELPSSSVTGGFVILLVSLYWYFMVRQQSAAPTDPYGLFHLTLNRLPGDDPSTAPRTEWLNMGYWKDTNVFPEAAKALASRLVAAANLKHDGRVLDVGHGTGESLILLLSDANIPRPASLTGITSILEHSQRSLQRVEVLQNAIPETQGTEVKLYHGDAVYHKDGAAAARTHPFSKDSALFDSILVLDCAYHFNTRQIFLTQALEHLEPGGTIALADICFSASSLQSFSTRLLTKVLRLMPQANVISEAQYVAQMKEIGYQDIVLENITEDVFPGFVTFLKSRGSGWYIFGYIMHWYARAGAQFVIVSGKKK